MSKKVSFKRTAIFAVPFAILVGTASYLSHSAYKQGKDLEDVAFLVQNSHPLVTNREQLNDLFLDYINASGLDVSRVAHNKSTSSQDGDKKSSDYIPSPSDERIYGNPDAQFYIIEYSDFECPYCKEHFPQLLNLVDSSNGNIALVFKHVPVHGQASRVGSLATECAAEQNGNPGFYKMASAIFENTQSDGRGLTTPLDVLATRNGFDGRRLIDCVNSARPTLKIGADVREAAGLNIHQTPSTIVVHGEHSALVQGMVNGTGIMQMMAQLVDGNTQQRNGK